MPFNVKKGKIIEDILVFQSPRFDDERGFFQTIYRESIFTQKGLASSFVQDNFSYSKEGTLRGLHIQMPPFSQGKLVFVLQGRAWSVAVDARKASSSFGAWEAFELSADEGCMVWLPSGLVHGFLVLESCFYGYKTTEEYHPEAECGVRWDDGELRIPWPRKPQIISDKDRALPSWRELVRNLTSEACLKS